MENTTRVKVGDIILFGKNIWRVLDFNGNNALIITESLVEIMAYNTEHTAITWETCTLRKYLNGEFYNKFSAEERSRVFPAQTMNTDNPWFGTKGGNITTDKIFILSLEELVKYFGDSGQLKNKNPNKRCWMNDQYNSNRIAQDASGATSWWWLRTPGCRSNTAAYVNTGGSVNICGHYVDNVSCGSVRPALLLLLN